MPDKIDLAFTVLPEVYGKWLKAPPKKEVYLSLYQQGNQGRKGNANTIITLYEPHVFAFREWTEDLEKDY